MKTLCDIVNLLRIKIVGKMPPSQNGFGGFLLPIFISEKPIRK